MVDPNQRAAAPPVPVAVDEPLPIQWLKTLVALAWLAGVLWLIAPITREHEQQLAAGLRQVPQRAISVRWTAGIATVAFLTVVAARLLRFPWQRLILLLLILLPLPALALTSRQAGALLATLALLVLAWWLGSLIASGLLRPDERLVAWVVGGAYGLGLLAGMGGLLGFLGLLHWWVIWPVLVLGVISSLAIAPARRILRADLACTRHWLHQRCTATPFATAALGIAAVALLLALCGAFAPEIGSDAIRQRLATAAFFAREGRIVAAPQLAQSAAPGVGELVYAVALACAPLQAAKLLNLAVAACCAAGVWLLGRRLAGETAAVVAALAFITVPQVLALAQTAYADLFSTLFAVAAMIATVTSARLTIRAVTAIAALIGLGLLVKPSFRLIAVGLLVAMLLAVIDQRGRRGRAWLALRWGSGVALVAVVVFAASLAIFGLGRGEVPPIIDSALARFPSVRQELHYLVGGALADNLGLATKPTVRGLVQLPSDLLARTGQYGENRDGFVGYLVVPLLALVAVSRPRRSNLLILAASVAGILLWFLLARYLRYGVPLLALLAALGGGAFGAVQRGRGGIVRAALQLAVLALASFGLVGYLNTVLYYPGNLPYRVALGLQSRDDYLAMNVTAYPALRLLNTEPQATKAISAYEYPQLYADVPLIGVSAVDSADESASLYLLDSGDYSHIVVDRRFLSPGWDQLYVTREEFLRRNTVLVGGGQNSYLYRLVPPAQRGHEQPWTRGPELLTNGGFETIVDGQEAGWIPVGAPRVDDSGHEGRSGQRALRATPQDGYATIAPVTPDVPYLLSLASRAIDDKASARLQVNWLDEQNRVVGVAIEVVPASRLGYYQFSMLATTPRGATRAMVYAVAQQGAVWLDDLSLREAAVPPPAPPAAATTGGATGTAAAGTVMASIGASIAGTAGSLTATGSGAGTLGIGRYVGNPTGATGFAVPPGSAYFGLYLPVGSAFTGVTIVDCVLNGGTTLYWWNGLEWRAVTKQAPGPAGCITAALDMTTTPNLGQLSGAYFVAGALGTPFTDVPPGHPAYTAVQELSARGIVRGYGEGTFGVADPLLRAQTAALIARAMGWDTEECARNPFLDTGGVDDNLQRSICLLASKGVVQGYDATTFGPADQVLAVQVVSFITRALEQQGQWGQVGVDNGTLYPEVPASSGHRADVLTYAHYAGAIPGTTSGGPWPSWADPVTRGWCAQVLWQALAALR